jgi:hypothetical protein
MRGDSMTKTLQEIQEFNRRKIICAVNGTENYEEALKKELGVGCKVKIKNFITNNEFNEEIFVIDKYCFSFNETLFHKIGSYRHSEIIKIIGKPLTLDRVLLALEPYPNNFGIVAGNIARIDRKNHTYNFICPWGLTKPTLEKQSEETQRAIYELLGGENE